MTADPGAPRGQEEVPPAPRGQQELTADELLRRLEADGELTVAELTALARLDGGPDDGDAWDCDLESEPPPGWDCDPDQDCGAEPDDPPGRPCRRRSMPGSPTGTAGPGPGSPPTARWT